MALDKKTLLTPQPERTTAKIPGWGDIPLRSMSAANMHHMTKLYEAAMEDSERNLDAQTYAIACSVEDGNGQLLFDDADRAALKELDQKILNAVMEAIQRLNEVAEPEDEEKN